MATRRRLILSTDPKDRLKRTMLGFLYTILRKHNGTMAESDIEQEIQDNINELRNSYGSIYKPGGIKDFLRRTQNDFSAVFELENGQWTLNEGLRREFKQWFMGELTARLDKRLKYGAKHLQKQFDQAKISLIFKKLSTYLKHYRLKRRLKIKLSRAYLLRMLYSKDFEKLLSVYDPEYFTGVLEMFQFFETIVIPKCYRRVAREYKPVLEKCRPSELSERILTKLQNLKSA